MGASVKVGGAQTSCQIGVNAKHSTTGCQPVKECREVHGPRLDQANTISLFFSTVSHSSGTAPASRHRDAGPHHRADGRSVA